MKQDATKNFLQFVLRIVAPQKKRGISKCGEISMRKVKLKFLKKRRKYFEIEQELSYRDQRRSNRRSLVKMPDSYMPSGRHTRILEAEIE